MQNLKKLVEQYDVISFDIFDTLLLRPFMKPVDVFKYLERFTEQKLFAAKRIVAEQQARFANTHLQDITHDTIYEHIDSKYKNIQKIEADFERQILCPNKEIVEIFEYAKKLGKKVIIISDMYFSEEYLTSVLNDKGISGFDKLYVSSEYGLTKGSGDLYKFVLEDLDINTSSILHIGDNKKSDIERANSLGIATYYYLQVKEQFIKDPENIRLISLYDKEKGKADELDISLVLGLRIINWHNNKNEDYWYNFGYNYGGILIYAMNIATVNIAKERNLTDILFIARDGYALAETFKYFNNVDVKGHYVYATRVIKALCIEDKENSLYDKEVAKDYKEYIYTLPLKGDKIALVDTCAGTFSAQNLLQNFLKDEILGIYYGTSLNYKYNFISLSGAFNDRKTYDWNIVELLLTSPELPIVNFANKMPIYMDKENSNYTIEKERVDVFLKIYQGELQFIKNISALLGGYFVDFSCALYDKYIANYDKNLSENDKKYLSKLKHGLGQISNTYVAMGLDSPMSRLFNELRNNMERKK